MADQPKTGVNKRLCKTYLRNEQGQFTRRIFHLMCDLPINIQELILLKAAVARRLTTETFGEVHNALAVVCKLWLNLMGAPGFYERLKQQTFIADPMCRYLHTVQSISVTGVGSKVLSAVTLGNKLYVVKGKVGSPDERNLFSYDLDDSAVRHRERSKRVLTCTNRQPLIVNGLDNRYRVNTLLSSSITNTLYMLECDLPELVHARVLKVNPDTGAILVKWDLHFPWTLIRNMSLNRSGKYLLLRCQSSVFIYSTLTGALVLQRNLSAEDVLQNKGFLFAILLCDCLERLVILTFELPYGEVSSYLDDHQCLLMLSKPVFLVCHTGTERQRVLHMDDTPIAQRFDAAAGWYDGVRGLVFSPHTSGLKVIRVTY